mmetsp:Transcript_6850/g.24357  ORF Transcript_6850/g.24357 Transcript_6850/m.24357 type:complete len:246 (-) Transcript_6850:3590-4327(-)
MSATSHHSPSTSVHRNVRAMARLVVGYRNTASWKATRTTCGQLMCASAYDHVSSSASAPRALAPRRDAPTQHKQPSNSPLRAAAASSSSLSSSASWLAAACALPPARRIALCTWLFLRTSFCRMRPATTAANTTLKPSRLKTSLEKKDMGCAHEKRVRCSTSISATCRPPRNASKAFGHGIAYTWPAAPTICAKAMSTLMGARGSTRRYLNSRKSTTRKAAANSIANSAASAPADGHASHRRNCR